jgi:NitT/TauT family transport system substrate-binding protein
MPRFHRLCILILALLISACAIVPARPTTTPTPITIRIAYGSDIDLGDIPSLITQERLIQQNFRIETTFFATADLAAEALAKGDMDLAYGAPQTFWTAASKGGAFKLIAEQVTNTFVIVARSDLAACADLDGKALGLHSENAMGSALVYEYIKLNCPSAQPQYLVMPGSDNRAAALLQGELDASLLEFSDFDNMETQAPGKFRVISNIARDIPDLIMVGLFANDSFAGQHPDVVENYLKTSLEVSRDIASDHTLLIGTAVEKLGTSPDLLQRGVENYFNIRAWDLNGGLTTEKLAFTLDFMTQLGTLDSSITAERAADLTYLDAALETIGRK